MIIRIKRYSKTPYTYKVNSMKLGEVLISCVKIGLHVLLALPLLIYLMSKTKSAVYNQLFTSVLNESMNKRENFANYSFSYIDSLAPT